MYNARGVDDLDVVCSSQVIQQVSQGTLTSRNMQPQRLTHCEQYCFSKVHIHYPSKETFYICYHG